MNICINPCCMHPNVAYINIITQWNLSYEHPRQKCFLFGEKYLTFASLSNIRYSFAPKGRTLTKALSPNVAKYDISRKMSSTATEAEVSVTHKYCLKKCKMYLGSNWPIFLFIDCWRDFRSNASTNWYGLGKDFRAGTLLFLVASQQIECSLSNLTSFIAYF